MQRTRAGPHTSGELMFDHVKFGVSDYAASKAFFLKALEPLGVAVVAEGSPTYGIELCPPDGKSSLCLLPDRGEAGASSPGVHGGESPAGRSLLSRGSGGGWQGQWCAWVCARTITRTTMRLSSLVRTDTTSKWFATSPGPDPSIEGTSSVSKVARRYGVIRPTVDRCRVARRTRSEPRGSFPSRWALRSKTGTPATVVGQGVRELES